MCWHLQQPRYQCFYSAAAVIAVCSFTLLLLSLLLLAAAPAAAAAADAIALLVATRPCHKKVVIMAAVPTFFSRATRLQQLACWDRSFR